MNLDLSKFKKIESDDRCTVLAHPSGHKIKVAHKGISPEIKKQIENLPLNLAKGGMVSKPSKSSNTMPGSPTEAKNSFNEPDDTGGSALAALQRKSPPFGPLGDDPEEKYPPCINPSCKSYGHSHPNCRCYGGSYAEGGEVTKEYYCDDNRMHRKGCEYFADGGEAGLSDSEKLDVAAQDAAKNSPPPIPDQGISQNPEIQNAPQEVSREPDSTPISNPGPDYSDAGQTLPTPVQQFQASKGEHLNQMLEQNKAFMGDLDAGHIKPETVNDLFAKKDTLGKVGTLFGLLVSGIGGGLTGHGGNATLTKMQQEIQNDLQAQQESVGNQQNFLKINQQGLANQSNIAATNVDTGIKSYAQAQTQMNLAAFHHFVTMANKLPPGSPQYQQAQQQLAMMWPAVQNANLQILDKAAGAAAFQNMIMGNSGGGNGQAGPEQSFQKRDTGLRMLGPQGEKRAEDLEEKHYPGIPGQASMPLSGEDREQIHSGITFDKTLNSFRDWAKNHSGDLNPKDRAYGQALAADVQGAYRQATKGGVYKEGEANFISGIIDSNPTKFFNEVRVLPKLDAAASQNKLRLDQILKDKGFHGYPGMQNKQQIAPQQNQQTATNPKTGKKVILKNGKWVPFNG